VVVLVPPQLLVLLVLLVVLLALPPHGQANQLLHALLHWLPAQASV